MRKILWALLIFSAVCVQHADAQSYPITVIPCASGFVASSTNACGQTGSLGSGYFWNLNGLSGSAAQINPTGCNHCGNVLNYQKTPVNVQAFTATITFVPNEYNGYFILQNNTATTAFGPCSPGSCGFTGGAGYEGGFYQGFGGPASTNKYVAINLYDNHSIANCTNITCSGSSYTGSSVNLYQPQQPPYNPNYGDETWYWTTERILTSPVQFSNPATTQQTTTGHTYTATIGYDGSNLTLSEFDVTAGGTCTPVTSGTCFSQSWSNVNIPSLVGSNTAYLGISGGTNGASANPFNVAGLTYLVNTPPSTPSFSSYTSKSYTGSPYVAAPTFSPAAGTYAGTQSVTIASTTPSAYYCYTLSATVPSLMPQTDNSGGCVVGTKYTGAISIASSQTLYAMAGNDVNTGTSGQMNLPSNLVVGAYSIGGSSVATPVITPVTGTYSTNQTVSITDSTPSAVICYTTDGSTPAAATPGTCSHGTTYTAPFLVSSSTTIKALGTLSGLSNSSVASVTLTITYPTLATPTFSPASGTYVGTQVVTVSGPAGATLCATTDGSTPTGTAGVCSHGSYSGPITVSTGQTINAIATQASYTNSAIVSASYVIVTATPTFSPIGGTYTSAQTVSILDATPGATIYYTTDGSTPTTGSTVYTTPLSIGATTTLKAIAQAAGVVQSGVGTAVYTINLPAAVPPTFSPAGGTYTTMQSVALASTTPSRSIYYTIDGTTPTYPTTGTTTLYTAPITVAVSLTINAIAVASGYSNSSVASAAYIISSVPTLAAPTFSPVAGAYFSNQTVAINGPSGSTICYTVGVTPPTAPTPGTCGSGSTTYSTPLVLTGTETLNALATQSGFSNSTVNSGVFSLTVATPVLAPGTGTYASAQIVTISSTTPGATIYYTLDGSTPTTSSPVYSSPLIIGVTTTVNALAVLSGATNSAIGTATYTLPASAVINLQLHGNLVISAGTTLQ